MTSARQLNFEEPIEAQISPVNGNTRLVSYGIQTEESDYRIHVCYPAQHIYIYPTASGKALLLNPETSNRMRGFSVTQDGVNGVVTGEGKLAPISWIDGLRSVLIPRPIYEAHPIFRNMATSTKGARAMEIALSMLRKNLVPLPVHIDVVDDTTIQVSGADMIIIASHLRVQVKCDYPGGDKQHGGTGNLALQTRECNPRKAF